MIFKCLMLLLIIWCKNRKVIFRKIFKHQFSSWGILFFFPEKQFLLSFFFNLFVWRGIWSHKWALFIFQYWGLEVDFVEAYLINVSSRWWSQIDLTWFISLKTCVNFWLDQFWYFVKSFLATLLLELTLLWLFNKTFF